MSIVVRVPIEIDDYKEKIIGGLSLRQLIFGGIALVTGAVTYILLKNINTDLATYAIFITAAPAFCIGYIKPKGYNFEEYVKIRLYCFLSKDKRNYETNPDENFLPIELEAYRHEIQIYLENEKNAKLKSEFQNKDKKRGVILIVQQKKDKFQKKQSKRNSKPESDSIEVTKKSIKRKRKAAAKSLRKPTGINRKKKSEKEKAA